MPFLDAVSTAQPKFVIDSDTGLLTNGLTVTDLGTEITLGLLLVSVTVSLIAPTVGVAVAVVLEASAVPTVMVARPVPGTGQYTT